MIPLPRRGGPHDPVLTYKQLAAGLGVSERFLKARVAEGMPSCGLDYAGRRLFRLSEVIPWLDARQERLDAYDAGCTFTPFRREEAS